MGLEKHRDATGEVRAHLGLGRCRAGPLARARSLCRLAEPHRPFTESLHMASRDGAVVGHEAQFPQHPHEVPGKICDGELF